MSTVMQTSPTTAAAFEAQFGTPPGTQDAKTECEKWQQLCEKLLAERQRLRDELDKIRLDAIFAEWDREPIPTWEEVQKTIDRTSTFEQLIAEIEREAENEK